MRKTLLPMIASLAFCLVAAAALIGTKARAAQSGGFKPMMIALIGTQAANPTARHPVMIAQVAPDAGLGREPAPDAMTHGERHAQFCQTAYARKVGKLAFLEARLSLTPAQTPLFARWKTVSLNIARQHQAACADHRRPHQRPTIMDRLTMEEGMLKQRLADIQAERPALAALYAALTPAQRAGIGHAGRGRGMMMDMTGRSHPGPMGAPGMDQGLDGMPPEPPPAQ